MTDLFPFNRDEPQAVINYTFDITCGASNAARPPSLSMLTSRLPSLAALSKNLITHAAVVHFVNYRKETLRHFSLHHSLLVSSLFLISPPTSLLPPLSSLFLPTLSSLLSPPSSSPLPFPPYSLLPSLFSFPHLFPPPAGKGVGGLCQSSAVLHLHLMWFQYDPATDTHVKRFHPGIMAS